MTAPRPSGWLSEAAWAVLGEELVRPWKETDLEEQRGPRTRL